MPSGPAINSSISFIIHCDLDSKHVVELQPKLEALLDDNVDHIILDFTDVKFIDSTGIGAIVFLFKRLTSQKRMLSLLNVSGQPHKLMSMLRVNNAIPFIDNTTGKATNENEY